MTSIDDLFKKPSWPSGKRKLDPGQDPDAIYKSAKLTTGDNSKGKSQASVEDAADGDDGLAGPTLPMDIEDEDPDDEEGRFFGGGISKGTAEILDFMDGQEGGLIFPEKIDGAWLRKTALSFEKRISKNAELRAKFEDSPQKFMASEADLDADIKALSILSEHPNLYEDFASLGCVGSLVGLLSHENTDIAIDAVEIISELTDEDVEATQPQWDALVDTMLEADLLGLLTQNFSRFNEDNESDRSGVYHALSVIENLSSKASIAERIGTDTAVLPWLIKRAATKESPVGQNKQYAAEIIAILLQSSEVNRKRFTEIDGVDVFLQLLSAYRKRDPAKGTEEEEFVENIFDAMICLVGEADGKEKFVEAEGVELCLIMLKEGMMSKPRALRLLDHAVASLSGVVVSERLVEAAGLKSIFGMLMKKHDSKTTEHLIGIISALLRQLPAESSGRIRTLAKFVEKDYEKVARIIKLRRDYAARLSKADDEIQAEKTRLSEEEHKAEADAWFEKRLDAGLFSLQTIDIIIAWLVAEDDGAKGRIITLLAERDENLGSIRATLQEQLDTIADEGETEGQTQDMLETLIQFL